MSEKKTDLIIQVKWKATIDGQKYEGIESEASWFLFDQIGTVLSHGPMKPIKECIDDYDEIIPLIKIKGKFMSIKEIESNQLPPLERDCPKCGGKGYKIVDSEYCINKCREGHEECSCDNGQVQIYYTPEQWEELTGQKILNSDPVWNGLPFNDRYEWSIREYGKAIKNGYSVRVARINQPAPPKDYNNGN